MSAEVETMAYNKVEVPWHKLGKPVEGDLTPEQMKVEAGADWTVRKVPGYYELTPGAGMLPLGRSALIRSKDDRLLDVVSDDWNPVQNDEAFQFFNDFVNEGSMNMETAGVLRGGQLVWALARTNESFDLFGGDQVDSYLLFTNPHLYGWSTSVSWTGIRVVCMNTLVASLQSSNKDKIIKISHRREFLASQVKETLGVSKKRLEKYKEVATFLGSKKAEGENVIEYFKRIFPSTSTKGEPESKISKNANLALTLVETQPGHEYAAGTWWQPYNAVTRMADHVMGRTDDNRMFSAWYGDARKKKIAALKLAVEMAEQGAPA